MNGITVGAYLALCAGSLIGATLRWLAQIVLNPALVALPLGTLLVNVVGGFVIGMAVAGFQMHPDWPQTWRVFAIPGVLGGLTTFSSFSAESMLLLQEGRIGWALAHVLAHVLGALIACFAGYAVMQKF